MYAFDGASPGKLFVRKSAQKGHSHARKTPAYFNHVTAWLAGHGKA
jgi:hypothetical protein